MLQQPPASLSSHPRHPVGDLTQDELSHPHGDDGEHPPDQLDGRHGGEEHEPKPDHDVDLLVDAEHITEIK